MNFKSLQIITLLIVTHSGATQASEQPFKPAKAHGGFQSFDSFLREFRMARMLGVQSTRAFFDAHVTNLLTFVDLETLQPKELRELEVEMEKAYAAMASQWFFPPLASLFSSKVQIAADLLNLIFDAAERQQGKTHRARKRNHERSQAPKLDYVIRPFLKQAVAFADKIRKTRDVNLVVPGAFHEHFYETLKDARTRNVLNVSRMRRYHKTLDTIEAEFTLLRERDTLTLFQWNVLYFRLSHIFEKYLQTPKNFTRFKRKPYHLPIKTLESQDQTIDFIRVNGINSRAPSLFGLYTLASDLLSPLFKGEFCPFAIVGGLSEDDLNYSYAHNIYPLNVLFLDVIFDSTFGNSSDLFIHDTDHFRNDLEAIAGASKQRLDLNLYHPMTLEENQEEEMRALGEQVRRFDIGFLEYARKTVDTQHWRGFNAMYFQARHDIPNILCRARRGEDFSVEKEVQSAFGGVYRYCDRADANGSCPPDLRDPSCEKDPQLFGKTMTAKKGKTIVSVEKQTKINEWFGQSKVIFCHTLGDYMCSPHRGTLPVL